MIYFWFVFGTIVGSFLNVCIYRLPRGESIVFPPSHCPNCKTRLTAIDLIPIVGFLLLRGRCRSCRQPISLRYPLVELLGGLFFSVSWLTASGDPVAFFFLAAFLSLLLVIFFTDLEKQVIPDAVSLPGIALGLVYNLTRGLLHPGSPGLNRFLSALLGMALGFGLLYLIARAGRWWFKKETMGEGDWYLGALLGAYLGGSGVLLAIFIAYLSAGLAAGILLAARKARLGQYIPFGPALVFGAVVTVFWGERILAWYLRLLV